jgi:hypothetical protein
MALVWGDSFDHYLVADILKKWTSQSASAQPDIAPAYALAPHSAGLLLAAGAGGSYIEKSLPAALTTFVCGFWFRTGSLANASIIATFMDSATPANIHVSLRYDATAHLTLCRDATVLATSTNTLSLNTWYHVEIKATIGDAADSPSGRYEVRIDGSATNWIPDSGTGKDTRNSGNASIGSFRLYSRGATDTSTNNHRFQDVYVLNTTGAVASDFVGPCRFAICRPAAVGATAEWTGNYADNWQNACDQYADGDTTFNQSSTAGQTDQFTMSDVPAGTVHAIQHVIMAKRDAGGARTIRPVTRISGSDYNGTTVTVAASYLFLTEALSISPASSAQFTDTEVNALEGGYELVS